MNLILCVLTATFALPGGYLYVIPVQKAALILFALSAVLLLVMSRSREKGQAVILLKDNLIELTAVAAAFIWMIAGIAKWHGLALTCFRLLILPFTAFWLIRQLNERNMIETALFTRVFFVTMIVKMTARLAVEILYLLVLNREQIYWIYGRLFQTEIMFMGDQYPYARIQCPTDLIAILIIPLFFFSRRLAKRARIALFLLYAAFSIIVASRVYWLYLLIMTGICLFVYRKKISQKEWAVIGLAGLIVILVLGGPIVRAVSFRFSSNHVEASDSARIIQAKALMKDIAESPVFGHGLGATVSSYNKLRGGILVYELEYLWLIDQLGIIGFIIVIGGIYATYVRRILAVSEIHGLKKRLPRHISPTAVVLLLAMAEMLLHPVINPAVMGIKNGFFWISCYLFAADQDV